MNKLFITGNLCGDPESRNTQDGKNVCTFTVAVNRRKKDRDGNSVADFFRVSAWGILGENCQKYLAKGRKVTVIGQVSVHAFTGKDGQAKGSLEVFAEDVEFLPSAGGEQAAVPAAGQAAGFTPVETDELPF